MPDLPEVETIKREFARELIGRTITAVDIMTPSSVNIPAGQFEQRAKDADFVEVARRAKFLVAKLSNGYSLIWNLKMSGQLVHGEPPSSSNGTIHAVFTLDDGSKLFLRDVNAFASIVLLRSSDVTHFFAHLKLGPEPLKPKFDFDAFRLLVRRHPKARIKPLLIDDQFVAGIGGIYADEILFAARVHPTRLASELSDDEVQRIFDGIKRILPEAIEHRGTTTEFYLDLHGERGGHQEYLKVHSKTGQPCEGCPGVVERITVAGRDTYVCPGCQR